MTSLFNFSLPQHLFPEYRSTGFLLRKAFLIVLLSVLTIGLGNEFLRRIILGSSGGFWLLKIDYPCFYLPILLLQHFLTYTLVLMVIVLEWIRPLLYLALLYTAAFIYLILLSNSSCWASFARQFSPPLSTDLMVVFALFWITLVYFLFDLLTAPYSEAVAAAEADADFEEMDFF